MLGIWYDPCSKAQLLLPNSCCLFVTPAKTGESGSKCRDQTIVKCNKCDSQMSWKIAGTIGTQSPKSSANVLCAQPKRKSNLQVSATFDLQAITIIIATIIIITTSLSLRSCGRCRRWHVRGHPNSILTWRSAPRMFRFPLVLM